MERNENVEKLLTTVEKLGFSKDVQEQVKEHMKNGLAAFSAYESMPMGQNLVDYQLNFTPSKNHENPNVYLNSIDVLLNKAVVVPHKTVLGFDTSEAETLLKNKPNEQIINPFNKEEFDRLLFVHTAKVDEKMKFLSEHAPEVFNALYVKYKPETEVPITPEMQKQQEELQKGLVRYNSFSTYYNLTKLEMYNAMDGGAIFKTLYKVNKAEEQSPTQNANQEHDPVKDNKYKAWVRVDFNNKRADGSYEMEMFHENRNFNLRKLLSNYNFKETNDRFSRGDVVKFLEKGSKFMVTTFAEKDDRVLIRANPEFKNIDIYTLSNVAIRSPKAFLKNPVAVEVTDVVSLKKADDLQPRAAQQPMSAYAREEKAAIFQSAKTVFGSDQKKTSILQQPEQNNYLENKSETSKQNKTQNGSIERRNRNTSRTLADNTTRQGVKP